MLLCYKLFIFQNQLILNSYWYLVGVSNSMEPDQALHAVWSDLASNCLQVIDRQQNLQLTGKELNKNVIIHALCTVVFHSQDG